MEYISILQGIFHFNFDIIILVLVKLGLYKPARYKTKGEL